MYNDNLPTASYTLSLHDALPIFGFDADALAALRAASTPDMPFAEQVAQLDRIAERAGTYDKFRLQDYGGFSDREDRKSTRLNSSHSQMSYVVFCLNKKNSNKNII